MNAIDISKMTEKELSEYLKRAVLDPDDIGCIYKYRGMISISELKVCDCGATKTSNPNCHSNWCPASHPTDPKDAS